MILAEDTDGFDNLRKALIDQLYQRIGKMLAAESFQEPQKQIKVNLYLGLTGDLKW